MPRDLLVLSRSVRTLREINATSTTAKACAVGAQREELDSSPSRCPAKQERPTPADPRGHRQPGDHRSESDGAARYEIHRLHLRSDGELGHLEGVLLGHGVLRTLQ